MIICAAVKLDMGDLNNTSLIVPGRRHGDCWDVIRQLNDNWKGAAQIEGFLDHNGKFYDRQHALAHATACGQLTKTTLWYKEDHEDTELYSEDLY